MSASTAGWPRTGDTDVVGCFARARSGQAAAEAIILTKSRRLIAAPRLGTRHLSGSNLYRERNLTPEHNNVRISVANSRLASATSNPGARTNTPPFTNFKCQQRKQSCAKFKGV